MGIQIRMSMEQITILMHSGKITMRTFGIMKSTRANIIHRNNSLNAFAFKKSCFVLCVALYKNFAQLGPLGYQDIRPMNDYLNLNQSRTIQKQEYHKFVLNCIFDRTDCADTTGNGILVPNQKYGSCYSFGT